jgi:hypothetical protein
VTAVDLDRLADYVGGALDGTPDAAAVRHLIDSEPAWADAYVELVTADALVQRQLGDWGAEALEVPNDVFADIDAALAAAHRPEVVEVPARDELAERRSRRRRVTIGLSAAAAIVIVGFGGAAIVQQAGGDTTATSTDSAAGAGAAPHTAKAPALAPESGSPPVRHSGTDYTPQTLGSAALSADAGAAANSDSGGTFAKSEHADDAGGSSGSSAPAAAGTPVPQAGGLGGLNACLSTLTARYGGQVTVVDVARFQGQPADIVVLEHAPSAGDRRLAVVVSPTCTELFHTPI